MTCDLKKLGCFFSLPEMKPSVLMMLAGMNTMLMWESVMRMHTTAPCPWPLSQERSKHSVVTSWAASCQTRDPHYH